MRGLSRRLSQLAAQAAGKFVTKLVNQSPGVVSYFAIQRNRESGPAKLNDINMSFIGRLRPCSRNFVDKAIAASNNPGLGNSRLGKSVSSRELQFLRVGERIAKGVVVSGGCCACGASRRAVLRPGAPGAPVREANVNTNHSPKPESPGWANQPAFLGWNE